MFEKSIVILRFVHRQVKQIRQQGARALYLKVGRLVRAVARLVALALLFPLLLPVLLVVRAVSPIKLIRFGRLRGERLGHLVLEPEFYWCERDVGLDDPQTQDFFYFSQPACNRQVERMLRRMLRISVFVEPLDVVNRLVPGGKKHIVPLYTSKHEDVHGLFDRVSPHFTFTQAEELAGAQARKRLGVPEGAPFICFIARDSSYLASRFKQDFSYHDYRDSNIQNYIAAAETLVDRGCYAIRMGAIVTQPVGVPNPGIIDYAVKARSDFLDVYFFAKCRFLISSNSGGCAIAMAFRRPIAFVNAAPFLGLDGTVPLDNVLFIPKKYWRTDQQRFMTFREILECGADQFYLSEEYEALGIELVENTSEEIRALAVEMDERLNGTWRETEEDKILQERFRELLRAQCARNVRIPPIGTEFLRQNRRLLD